MAEKFRKVVNAPHKAFGRAREKIREMTPESKSGKVARIAGLTTTGLFQFLLWAIKYVTLDNHVLRKAEDLLRDMKVGKNKNDEDKKFAAFMKNNPNFSAHILYYLVAAMTVGGVAVYENVSDKDKAVKEIKVDNTKKLNPQSQDFISQCVALENITCIPLVYAETYRATPKVQRKENVWTHGYGMTWSRDKKGRMTIRDYADTKSNRRNRLKPHKPQEQRTKDMDIDETQQFLLDHVYPKIKSNMSREITENELYALCLAGYQLEGHIATICTQLSAAQTQQQIADSFITSTMYRYGGTPKRRWVCGMLAAGFITIQDILNADIDNFYLADQNTFIRNGHFICDANTIDYVLGLKRKKNTHAEIMELADGRLALEQLKGHAPSQQRIIAFDNSEESKNISESMGGLIKAQKKFDSGDYVAAAKLFEDAIGKDPDNMEAYSSLALTYKKMGDKNRTVEYYEKCCDVVKRCNARMNANRSLLMDYDVKASSYFNAGLAREEMADIYAASGQRDRAKRNYDLAQKNFQTARENCLRGGGEGKRLETYDAAMVRVGKKVKSKKLTFNMSAKSIENNAHSADFNMLKMLNDERRG